jgi:hypothetical protein
MRRLRTSGMRRGAGDNRVHDRRLVRGSSPTRRMAAPARRPRSRGTSDSGRGNSRPGATLIQSLTGLDDGLAPTPKGDSHRRRFGGPIVPVHSNPCCAMVLMTAAASGFVATTDPADETGRQSGGSPIKAPSRGRASLKPADVALPPPRWGCIDRGDSERLFGDMVNRFSWRLGSHGRGRRCRGGRCLRCFCDASL